MYKSLDYCDHRYVGSGSVQDHHALSAVLQFPRRLCEESGMLAHRMTCIFGLETDVVSIIVLASSDNLSLLWTSIPGPPLPCLLPPTIFTLVRREQWPIPRPLFMASPLRHLAPHLPVTPDVNSIPGICLEQQLGVHLEPAEPRHKVELFGLVGLHCAILAMGIDGVLVGVAWNGTKGRNMWRNRWPQ